MVEFLNKDASYAKIVEIVSKADSKLVLISPYIKIPSDLLERLKYMDGKEIKTIVVCREKDLNAEVKSELKQLKNLDLRFDENLHAKCFYNEKSMVITSLNLYEHSQQNNREMGILLDSKEDTSVFNEALSEADFIVNRAKKEITEFVVSKPKREKPNLTQGRATSEKQGFTVNTPKNDSILGSIVRGVHDVIKELNTETSSSPRHTLRPAKTTRGTTLKGFCIRCGKSITFDTDAPYCPDCYRVWARFKDPDFEEDFCHLCGTSKAPTTMNKPVCISCFRKSKR